MQLELTRSLILSFWDPGDELAAGYGDWATIAYPTGLARHLPNMLNRGKVRLRWSIVDRGIAGSCSAEWLPNAPSSKGHNLLTRVLTDKDTSDCDIVMIALGMHDHQRCGRFGDDSAEFTLRNLQAISQHLVAAGKRVLVCRLPMPVLADGTGSLPSIQERQAQAMRRFNQMDVAPAVVSSALSSSSDDPLEQHMVACQSRNECIDVWLDELKTVHQRLLKQYLDDQDRRSQSASSLFRERPQLSISIGVDFAVIACRNRQMRAWDFIHPSSSCYERATRISEENWLPSLVQAEWKVLRPALESRGN